MSWKVLAALAASAGGMAWVVGRRTRQEAHQNARWSAVTDPVAAARPVR